MKIVTLGCSMFLMLAGCAHQQAKTPTADSSSSSSAKNDSSQMLSPGSCTTDAQCTDGMTCVNGKCVDRGADLAACMNVRVHFTLDSSEIATDDRPQLERAATCLRDSRSTKVKIEGNADERGTEEYNMALGDRRAESVSRYLQKLGATKDQVQTVSYGKDAPVCQEHDEACWSKNRRAAVKPSNK